MLQKNFDILATDLKVLHNYFDNKISTKFFSDLYSAKILDLSAKPFFPRITLIFILTIHLLFLVCIHIFQLFHSWSPMLKAKGI